ncbi:MAG: GntR family transcriptional regulator [Bacillota bacterium]|nr:GntR family transcriptional regulator [Bacillota bacterium]
MAEYEIGSFKIELDLTKPLYEQVLDQIRHAIARGEVELGSKIPSVRELALQLKINPNTVMRAYQELERDKLCETRRGQGTFITTSEEKVMEIKKSLAKDALNVFVSSMKDLGMDRSSAQKLLEEVEWE